MKRLKYIGTVIASLLFFLALFVLFQELVIPKYVAGIPEGNFTSEYYDEEIYHDVIMIGDCEVYENINPMYLWENYGISGYIRGNAQQLVWQSYYMLEDTLKYEKPKVVIYNVQSLTHATPQKEEYNRMTLDGMRWSESKLKAVKASMCEEESLIDYIFPIFRYHSRITELQKEDFTYLFHRKKVSNNGYYLRMDVIPYSESDVVDGRWLFDKIGLEEADTQDEEKDILSEEIIDPWAMIDGAQQSGDNAEYDAESESDNNDIYEDSSASDGSDVKSGEKKFGNYPMQYLDKLRELCEENDIKLILMKAPSLSPRWYDEENEQVVEYSEKYGLTYINFYELINELDIDYETDTYDGGLHLNYYGACKISEYIGRYLIDNCGVPDRRSEKEYTQVYEEKMEYYNQMKEKQLDEIRKYGKVNY